MTYFDNFTLERLFIVKEVVIVVKEVVIHCCYYQIPRPMLQSDKAFFGSYCLRLCHFCSQNRFGIIRGPKINIRDTLKMNIMKIV